MNNDSSIDDGDEHGNTVVFVIDNNDAAIMMIGGLEVFYGLVVEYSAL